MHAGEGATVLLLYPSANRDATKWGPTADQLDLRRPDAQVPAGYKAVLPK